MAMCGSYLALGAGVNAINKTYKTPSPCGTHRVHGEGSYIHNYMSMVHVGVGEVQGDLALPGEACLDFQEVFHSRSLRFQRELAIHRPHCQYPHFYRQGN